MSFLAIVLLVIISTVDFYVFFLLGKLQAQSGVSYGGDSNGCPSVAVVIPDIVTPRETIVKKKVADLTLLPPCEPTESSIPSRTKPTPVVYSVPIPVPINVIIRKRNDNAKGKFSTITVDCTDYQRSNSHSGNSRLPILQKVDSIPLSQFKSEHLISAKYAPKAILLRRNLSSLVSSSVSSTSSSSLTSSLPMTAASQMELKPHQQCRVIVNQYLSLKITKKQTTCSAIVRVTGLPKTLNLLRFDGEDKFGGILNETQQQIPTGFFRKASHHTARIRIGEKLNPLLKSLPTIDTELGDMLANNGFSPYSGGENDIVVMVVNEGEFDIFLNFICSCKAHSINVHRVLVLCGNAGIVPMVQASGAMGYYHASFAAVSREASGMYLDQVFTAMMWYKAFAVWLVMRLQFNVLFQVCYIIGCILI